MKPSAWHQPNKNWDINQSKSRKPLVKEAQGRMKKYRTAQVKKRLSVIL